MIVQTPGSSPRRLFTRRASLHLAAGGLILPALGRTVPAAAETDEVHGLSIFGDLQLPKDFPHLPYADPKASKGGEVRLQMTSSSGNQNLYTFNTLNIFNQPGDGAAGVSASFDSLMSGNADEPDALYGLVARGVVVSPDKLTYRFLLRKEARFFDGTPLTAKDVAFSLNILRDKGHFTLKFPLKDMKSAVAEGDDVVVVTLQPTHARDAILMVAGLPIFSAAYYGKVPFDEVSLEPPLGSGAYKVGRFEQGKYVAMVRNDAYWAKDLPINIGTNNFETIRYDYFGDRTLAFEGFKAGDFTFHEELKASTWAKGYDFPAVAAGRVKKEFIPDDYPMGDARAGSSTRGATSSRIPASARRSPTRSTSNGRTPTSCTTPTSAPCRISRTRRWPRPACLPMAS